MFCEFLLVLGWIWMSLVCSEQLWHPFSDFPHSGERKEVTVWSWFGSYSAWTELNHCRGVVAQNHFRHASNYGTMKIFSQLQCEPDSELPHVAWNCKCACFLHFSSSSFRSLASLAMLVWGPGGTARLSSRCTEQCHWLRQWDRSTWCCICFEATGWQGEGLRGSVRRLRKSNQIYARRVWVWDRVCIVFLRVPGFFDLSSRHRG